MNARFKNKVRNNSKCNKHKNFQNGNAAKKLCCGILKHMTNIK